MADVDPLRAGAAAEHVNRLADRRVARSAGGDVADRGDVARLLEPFDAALAAVSYRLNEGITEAAIEARTHLCDLGGYMDVVRRQLALDEAARRAGVAVIPDCGEAPGLANNLTGYACSLVDEVHEVRLYDGGIPRHPRPPWRYELTFSVDGLTNEYQGTTTFLRDGRPVEVACLDPAEDEVVDLGPPFGRLEALVAATASTLPFTVGSGVRTFTSKVLRWPGHGEQFRAFRDLGLFDETPIEVDGAPDGTPRGVPCPPRPPDPGPRGKPGRGPGPGHRHRDAERDRGRGRGRPPSRPRRASGVHGHAASHRMARRHRHAADGLGPGRSRGPSRRGGRGTRRMVEEVRGRGFVVVERLST